MINMESQTMGKIEKTISISDLTPGTLGTKAYHKTYGGLMEIQDSFAKRFSIMQMTNLAYLTTHMEIMYWLFMQFMFDTMTFTVNDKGVFKTENFSREDFDSGGEGFLFLQVTDPSFGDSSVQRNQLMVLFDQVMKYEQARLATMQQRRATGERPLKVAHLDEILERILEAFSTSDIESILSPANNALTPEEEFTLLIKGVPFDVNPREDFIEHLLAHENQLQEVMTGVENHTFPPQILQNLQAHIDKTKKMILLFVENSHAIAQARQAENMMGTSPESSANQPPNQSDALQLDAGNIGGLSQVDRPVMPMGGNNGSGVPQPE
jgi:hypothetical protein